MRIHAGRVINYFGRKVVRRLRPFSENSTCYGTAKALPYIIPSTMVSLFEGETIIRADLFNKQLARLSPDFQLNKYIYRPYSYLYLLTAEKDIKIKKPL